MLDTKNFLEKLLQQNYSHACVVPCSFAKNLINAIINHKDIEYIPCASEAVACSVAIGLKLAHKKPLVIVQSSGLTNMGSCITSLLKPYDITFAILTSWRIYKEGESEIQHKHLANHLLDLIDAYGYKSIILNNENIEKAVNQIEQSNKTNSIVVLEKNTFSDVLLDTQHQKKIQNYPLRSHYLCVLHNMFQKEDTIFIGTTGNTSREMYSLMPNTNNFYMVGNMGGALSLGTGFALAKKRVIVLGGDAEFVMHMGGLTTAGRYKNLDLTYILFDNEQNKSTGGQDTYQTHIDYIALAKASGFEVETKIITDTQMLEKSLKMKTEISLYFIHIKCALDIDMPRPPLNVVLRKEF